MLSARDVVVVHPGSPPVRAVDGVSLDVPPGTTVGLVGESGSGKSTLARALAGIAPPTSGLVELDGADLLGARGGQRRALRRQVQLVFQDPRASLSPRMTVGRAIREAAAIASGRRVEAAPCAERARELLGLVRLPASAADRYPHQLSGGQLQRVAIARALAVEPRYLLLDEVTASLDVSVQATILNLLRELRASLGLTYLYISHDLSIVRYVSDHVAVMRQGRIVERNDVETLFASPAEDYTKDLLKAVPTLGGSRWRRAGQPRSTRSTTTT